MKNDIEKLIELKNKAGTHSPSIEEIKKVLSYNPVKHDFCFLSNPYATELVIKEIEGKIDLFNLLEQYPANNEFVCKNISILEGLNYKNMVVGNGAIEAISWVARESKNNKILINAPTFSSYYEFYENYHLETNNLMTAKEILNSAENNNCNDILIIYPNNPDGSYMDLDELKILINQEKYRIILDESFSHFLPNYKEYRDFIKNSNKENFILIKSLSKDFGVAGARLGFLYSNNKEILKSSKKYTTWNLNNLAVLISKVISTKEFGNEYEKVRCKFNNERDEFYKELLKVDDIEVKKSGANFFLIKSNKFSQKFVFTMLVKYGLYVRTMVDKIGLDEKSIRVASRKKSENDFFLKVLKEELNA